MPSLETIDVPSLTGLVVAVFRRAGLSAEHAANSADILVEADMMGLGTHGVVRVPAYAGRLRSGGVDPAAVPAVDRRAPGLAVVDGHNGLGTVVGAKGLEVGLQMVAETGIAYVGCRASNHFGALAPYALKVCEAGYVFMGGTNASTTMIPWGGTQARMGNNPLCIAAPAADGTHFILDMAMSVAARGKIRAAQNAGSAIPDGWATDSAGVSTNDPSEALKGFLLPVGGHKGSGLALAVDILCGVLTDGRFLTDVSSWSDNPDAPSGIGHFFWLLDPDRMVGAESFAAAMGRFKEIVLATPPAQSAHPVLLPGQREQERRRAARRDGIELPGELLQSIRQLAGA